MRKIHHQLLTVALTLLLTTAVIGPFVAFGDGGLPVGTVSAGTTGGDSDTFEDGDMDGWTEEYSGTGSVVTASSHGSYSLEVTSDGTSGDEIEWTDGPSGYGSGDKFNLTIKTDDVTTHQAVTIGPSGSSEVLKVGYTNGNFNLLSSDSGTTNYDRTGNPSNGTWYDVEVRHDGTNITADWYYAKNGSLAHSHSVTAANDATGYVHADIDSSGPTLNIDRIGVNSAYTSSITGQAENQNGQPVANATIRLTTVDTSQIDASDPIAEAKERVRNASEVTPQFWDSSTQLSGSGGKFGNFSGKYPIVFRSEVSGNVFEADSDDISNPQLTVGSGQSFKVTSFDASQSGGIFGFGELSRQQPGAPADGGTVVFEQVDASNATVNKEYVELDKTTKELPGDPEYMHYNSTTLNAGFYRVYMKSNPAAWVPLRAGTPTEIINQNLEDIDNNPTPRSAWVADQINNGPMATQTTTTNSTGHFSASVPENAKVVGVQGIKASSLDIPEENLTADDMRENASQLNGSVYLPSRVYKVEPPKSDLTVQMYEASYPPYGNLSAYQKQWRDFLDRLRNGSFSDLPPAFQTALENVSDNKLKETNEKLDRLSRENNRLRERFHEEADDRNVDVTVDIDDANRTQLQKRMAAMQEALTSLESTVDTELVDESSGAGTSTISRTWEVGDSGTDINPAGTAVRIDYSNGTTSYLNATESDYVTVNNRAFQSDTVSVDEYPLGNASAAEVSVIAATSEGIGKASDSAANPALSGDVPQLRALDASTLVPETGEQVSITARPKDGTGFKSVTGATVYGPDGTTVNSSLSSNTLEFTPTQAGPQRVKLTFSNLDGEKFTEVVRLEAVTNGQDRPASVRAVSGPTGTYALVGGPLQSGEIDVKEGGGTLDVTAVTTDANETSEVHVYTEGMSLAPDHMTSVRVVEGDGEASIDRNARVVMHAPAFPEGAYAYRVVNGEKEPLPEGKSGSGIRRSGAENTTIQTYTNAKGEVAIRTISDPGLLEQAEWIIETRWPDVSLPGMAFAPVQSPAIRAGV